MTNASPSRTTAAAGRAGHRAGQVAQAHDDEAGGAARAISSSAWGARGGARRSDVVDDLRQGPAAVLAPRGDRQRRSLESPSGSPDRRRRTQRLPVPLDWRDPSPVTRGELRCLGEGRLAPGRGAGQIHAPRATRPARITTDSRIIGSGSSQPRAVSRRRRGRHLRKFRADAGVIGAPLVGTQPRQRGGVDTARAREAVLDLKPRHGGLGAGAEAAVGWARPVAATEEAPLDLAHAARAAGTACSGAERDRAGVQPSGKPALT